MFPCASRPTGLLGTIDELAGLRIGVSSMSSRAPQPQRENDGIGAAQRVTVVDGDDRSSTDSCSQGRVPDSLLALESRRVSPPEASRRAMTDPIPPVPIMAVTPVTDRAPGRRVAVSSR